MSAATSTGRAQSIQHPRVTSNPVVRANNRTIADDSSRKSRDLSHVHLSRAVSLDRNDPMFGKILIRRHVQTVGAMPACKGRLQKDRRSRYHRPTSRTPCTDLTLTSHV